MTFPQFYFLTALMAFDGNKHRKQTCRIKVARNPGHQQQIGPEAPADPIKKSIQQIKKHRLRQTCMKM